MLRSRHQRLKTALTQGATLAFILATASSLATASGPAPTGEAAASQAPAVAPSGTPGTPNVKDPYLADWLRLTPDRKPAPLKAGVDFCLTMPANVVFCSSPNSVMDFLVA